MLFRLSVPLLLLLVIIALIVQEFNFFDITCMRAISVATILRVADIFQLFCEPSYRIDRLVAVELCQTADLSAKLFVKNRCQMGSI
jgi:hypothetical protein